MGNASDSNLLNLLVLDVGASEWAATAGWAALVVAATAAFAPLGMAAVWEYEWLPCRSIAEGQKGGVAVRGSPVKIRETLCVLYSQCSFGLGFVCRQCAYTLVLLVRTA